MFQQEARRFGTSPESLFEEVWECLDPHETSRSWLVRYRGYSSLRTYLRVVVRHRLYDAFRSRSARYIAERVFTEQRYQHAVSAPATVTQLEEFRDQVSHALVSLPELERKLLLLRYQEGLTNGTVARRIGVSEGQASRLHKQAVAKLRKLLRPLWQDEVDGSQHGYSLYAQFLLRGLSETLALHEHTDTVKSDSYPKDKPMGLITKLPIIEPLKKRREKPIEERQGKLAGRRLKNKKLLQKPRVVTKDLPSSIIRESDRTGEEIPSPTPLDLDGLIPEAISEVVCRTTSPEDVFAKLQLSRADSLPEALCLDARDSSPEEARTWLDKFDALSYEKDDSLAIQLVVFLTEQQGFTYFEDLLTRPDIDWVLTDDRSSPLTKLYPEVVRSDLTALLSRNPTAGLHKKEDPAFRPVEEFLPEDQREEWRLELREEKGLDDL